MSSLHLVENEKHKFNAGDIVQLKSGGYYMTVGAVISPEASYATGRASGVHCHWHDEAGGAQSDVYREEQLNIREPAKPPQRPDPSTPFRKA